jgi:hypothetical protein
MEIDKIIEGLNSKKNIKDIGSGNFQNKDLTETEKNFMKTYTLKNRLLFMEHLLQMHLILQ